MKCDNPDVPRYLHWNDRKVFQNKDFYYYQKLYRLKTANNPIEIPEQWANAISCRWSRIISSKHITIQPPKERYDDYDFVYLQEIRRYKKIAYFDNNSHPFSGKHVITCEINHCPLPCDYSHTEILIRHKIFKSENGIENLVFNELYTHESWEKKTAMLTKERSPFFKGLKKEFRLDMIKTISRESKRNVFWMDAIAYCGAAYRKTGVKPEFRLD